MKRINLQIDGTEVVVPKGYSVASAIYLAETTAFRKSVRGENRFPLCGMGVCFECRVSINGSQHQRSCQIIVEDGMKITTDE